MVRDNVPPEETLLMLVERLESFYSAHFDQTQSTNIGELGTLARQVEELGSKIEKLSQRNAELERVNARLSKEVGDVEEAKRESIAAQSALNQQVSLLEEERHALIAACEVTRRGHEKLRADNDQLLEKVRQTELYLKEAEGLAAALSIDKQGLVSQVEDLQQQLQKTADQLNTLEEQLVDSRKENEDLRSELDLAVGQAASRLEEVLKDNRQLTDMLHGVAQNCSEAEDRVKKLEEQIASFAPPKEEVAKEEPQADVAMDCSEASTDSLSGDLKLDGEQQNSNSDSLNSEAKIYSDLVEEDEQDPTEKLSVSPALLEQQNLARESEASEELETKSEVSEELEAKEEVVEELETKSEVSEELEAKEEVVEELETKSEVSEELEAKEEVVEELEAKEEVVEELEAKEEVVEELEVVEKLEAFRKKSLLKS